ncbi:transcription antitermination factor NusB [Quatrionicoccus australiensis]|uniref:transcription antitermination factor NusB n=1 Tax=Quatrionicoccus australiensis TaxID=138118 RepID=UPI001CFC4535|nr:transcription antitermination factor NusB [Quatrionicoccus australiensis]MCB4360555.1 transcription antitermination factor NusB [Quatrionicoccus australiensis]
MTTFLSDSEHPHDVKEPPKSARRRAREFVLQGLYQWRVGGADEASIEAYAPEQEGFAKADREFFVGTLRGVIAQREALVSQITAHLDRPFSELSPIEACVLMLGCFEMLHHPETPYRVIINEAIELAKAFGGTDGHKYVNGVLDKVALGARPDEVTAKKKAH